MLALVLAAVVCVSPGATLQTDIDVGFKPLYQAPLSSDNPYVAKLSGSVAPRSSVGRVTVEGVKEGETGITIMYVSGISIYRLSVGKIVVGEPLAVAVSAPATVAEGSPVTLVAHLSGYLHANVAWYEGDTYLGIGSQLTLALPRGVHRIRAEAWNECGTVVGEVEITVGSSRRRAARH